MSDSVAAWFTSLIFRKKPDFLNLCERKARSIEGLVSGGNLLNQRQCQDLSNKISQTTLNIRALVSQYVAPSDLFRPALDTALEHLYRNLEKAVQLVKNCGEADWCAAAIFLCQNENAFREILLDVGLCYNAIYEQVKSTNEDWTDHLEDLRESSVFLPTTEGDTLEDLQDLKKRLEDIVGYQLGHSLQEEVGLKYSRQRELKDTVDDSCTDKQLDHSLPEAAPKHSLQKKLQGVVDGPSSNEQLDYFKPEEVALKHSLARYLLVKIHCASEQFLATTLDKSSEILWDKKTEPPGTWGSSHYLGHGATDGGVCSTTWLGIPCAKKEFHVKEYESLFLKEAGILVHLKHPCIINFICCSNGQARGDRFIAMELMERSLFDLIEEQKQKDTYFSLSVVADIIIQIARGVWYLHDQGVAHRDLKPQNVVVNTLTYPQNGDHVHKSSILENRFCVKLVDFGESKTKVEVFKSNTMTRRGIGTTMYRAPEVHPLASSSQKGKAVWFKADVFSFAMTCTHILSLKVPFHDKKGNPFPPDALYNALMNGHRPDLPDDCPAELVTLLKECWNTIPRKRPSFSEICTRLEILRHKVMRGLTTKEIDTKGLNFINSKIEAQSSLQKVFFDSINQEEEDDALNDEVAFITCDSGHALEVLLQPPYSASCNVCWEHIDGKVYHCNVCQFDAHRDCVSIKEKVNVFFHHHSLHLLVQNYYEDDPHTTCRVCEESVQDSEWVYRCEQCDFDVHAVCTKHSTVRMWNEIHPHLLAFTQCAPRQSLSCRRCNDKIKGHTWRYMCIQTARCAFDLHPFCAICPENPLCVFDGSHRLTLMMFQRGFNCGRCGALGFSWRYHCDYCDVDIHPDCVDDMNDEKGNWNGAYEKFMIEKGSKDDHTKMNMISELLDKLPVNDALNESASSCSRSPSVQPSIQSLTLPKRPSLDAFDDVNLQRKIAAETEERIKVKKMAAKEARQKFRENLLEMLENLEKIVLDLRSSVNVLHDDVHLTAMHEKLKRRQDLVKEQAALQVHSKMSQGPRIAVFFKDRKTDGKLVRELLPSLQADMRGVCYALLCEEPGHEHIVKVFNIHWFLGEEFAEKLQPLLASGLQVVVRAMSSLEPHELTGLECVTLPSLETGSAVPWDLGAVDLEMYSNQSKDLFDDEGKVEALKRAEDKAAEWFRSHLENKGRNILKSKGLQRIRYKVTEEGDSPKYRRGTLAWLCEDHVKSGLQDCKLESYPLKYFDVEDDHQLRCSVVMGAGM